MQGSRTQIAIRAPNWVGDAVMALPAIRAVREALASAELTVVARRAVADLYARERCIDRVLALEGSRREAAAALQRSSFDRIILLPNSLSSALEAWLARIPRRTGYRRDARGWLLTEPVTPPESGETPRHQRFYYLELLRRGGIIAEYPPCEKIEMDGRAEAESSGLAAFAKAGVRAPVIGVSPGAAYGNAKRWLPERFADAACEIAAQQNASVALFGTGAEQSLCEAVGATISARGIQAQNFAGRTTLKQFIELAAACRLFLTNDSGAMHIASALAVPTITIFGATDDTATGPTGAHARIVREQVECSPCMLRECPIDHRCMTRVDTGRVVATALELLA